MSNLNLRQTISDLSKTRIGKKSDPSADLSNKTVYDVSLGKVKVNVNIGSPMTPDQKIDQETVNLINWLAEEQNISPEYALKKAVGMAAYIHDLTENKGGKLLVLLQDGAIHEILLKNNS